MKTVLILDDEPAARYGLRKALEAKYRIAEADSAEAAREALTREQPDLLLLDVVLPGQDGLSFLKWMREQGSELPVLMVSALDTAKTAVQALQLGAAEDRKSTRLNSSHGYISYAVFCLKKKKKHVQLVDYYM